jgi:diguanylate cyclase (GGDEF)-like protein/hemerythrin-like metal-binding protein
LLTEIHQILPHFLTYLDAAVAIKDRAGSYLYANEKYHRYAGVEEGRVVGRSDTDVVTAERRAVYEAAERAVVRDGTPVSCEERLPHPAPDTLYISTRFPILDRDGALIAIGILALDISGKCLALSQAERALRDAERMNSQLTRAVQELERLASTDALTRAWNRRRFEETAEAEIHRSLRYGQPLSLAILDLDHFKRINDSLGHEAGDRALKSVAGAIMGTIRKADSLTRWGGEEFVVLMPNTGLSRGGQVAERVRSAVEGADAGGVGPVTVSIGLAEFVPGQTLKEWLGRADTALYQAKQAGRNRVAADPQTGPASVVERVANAFVQLVWKEDFQSGHDQIDAQHRGLFGLANELLSAALVHSPGEEVDAIAGRLLHEVAVHFEDEERVLKQVGYPEIQPHAKEHARLIEAGTRLRHAFAAGSVGVGSLFQFLAHEVVAQHMLVEDRRFFPYLAAPRPAALGPTEKPAG